MNRDSNRDKIFKLCGLTPKPLNESIEQDLPTSSPESDVMKGGNADEKSVIDFKPDQILKGMKVEMEHTDDPRIALEITMDHLTENEDYYDYLEDMESKFDNNKEE